MSANQASSGFASGAAGAKGHGASAGPSALPRRMVAFVADEQTEATLRGGLVEFMTDLDVRRGDVTDAVRFVERDSRLQVLLVDISSVEKPLEALDELARVCPPDMRVLAIGTSSDINLYRSLIGDLGITEYLPKPLTRDTVARIFGPHVAGTETARGSERGGRLIVVCGARGGAGTTTIALGLASLLARDLHSHVALLDLHLHRGTVALMAGVKTGAGLRIALENPERIDSLFLERAAVVVEDRLRIIAASEPLTQGAEPTENGVRRVVDLLRQKFNFVVVDMPVPMPAGRELMALARHIVVVMRPDVASLRDVLAIRELAGAEGTGSRVVTVLNHANMPGGLPNKMIERSLGGKPDVSIPLLGKSIVGAANLGKLPVREVPALARLLGPIVQEVSGGQHVAASRRKSWWRR